MTIFEIVKTSINTREAAERYGIDVNRYRKALCPFHNDRHPSMNVYDDHYHCFACGEHGDVINLVARLYDLPMYEAAQKLAYDYAYHRTSRPPRKWRKN
ncbi:MAG: CHC2 zinc finger domain-containing protein [Eubacteriales bacterium]|nr:CHC2 zinc finger domain-containing protein [Eubacteriales bacterium]